MPDWNAKPPPKASAPRGWRRDAHLIPSVLWPALASPEAQQEMTDRTAPGKRSPQAAAQERRSVSGKAK
jgi:hypothetical protein